MKSCGEHKLQKNNTTSDKAKTACKNSDQNISYHFADIGKTIPKDKLEYIVERKTVVTWK